MNIGKRIKELRTINNLTQEDLAKKLFVTRNAISKWETGKGLPNVESIKLLAKTFNVSTDYLINDEEYQELTIINTRELEFNKNLIYALILFVVFVLTGTVLPYFLLNYDPTGMLALFLIILPVIYIILGIAAALLKIKWPFVVISGAVAITPILLVWDMNSNSIVSPNFLVLYLLFLGVYFILNSLINKKIDKTLNQKLPKLFLLISLIITAVYLIQTIIEIIILIITPEASAAYYTPVVVNTVFYIIPLVLSYGLYFYYKYKLKTQDR